MKNWKKNAVVASILVFVCAGIYLNWLYTQDTETADLVDTLDQEKILGSSTLVMSQNDDLAADAGGSGRNQRGNDSGSRYRAAAGVWHDV
mgnify:CR=1 FL=1